MKIVLSHRYFYPDTAPYALMLRSIADALAASGHDVHVFASRPSYRMDGTSPAPQSEQLGAVHVKRCWVFQENRNDPLLRLVNVIIYCLRLFIHVLWTRPNVVTASTFPPVLAGWTASLAAKMVGAKFIYHCQDIHPEVSQLSGGRLGRGKAFQLLRWLDNQTLRRSAAIVVLSADMQRTLEERNISNDLPIHIINNFLLESFDEPGAPNPKLVKEPDRIRVIFAGNIGNFQNLPMVSKGVARLFEAYPNMELMFLGDGAALDGLKSQYSDTPQVRFSPFMPYPDAQMLIKNSDIGLVALQEELYKVAYPSKILSYQSLGLPILLAAEADTEMARAIEENGLGKVAPTLDPDGVAQALNDLLLNPIDRSNIQRWAELNIGRSATLHQWQNLVTSLIAS